MKLRTPSKFTLGTVQLGVNYGMANKTGKPDQEKAFAILDQAVKSGVRSLDTAAAYGTSEEVVGKWLSERNEEMFVTSKFKLKTDDPLSELETQIRNTTSRIPAVSGYMFHDADQMRKHSALVKDRLLRMKEESDMVFVGSSVYTKEDVSDFLDIGYLEAIQIPMSVLDTRIVTSGLLSELEKRGIMVFVRSIFLQGMLCMDHAPERFSFMENSLSEMREVADFEGMSLKDLSLSFIRDLPGVTSLVLGAETPEQVLENGEAMNIKSLSDAAKSQILEISKRVPIEHCMDVIMGKA